MSKKYWNEDIETASREKIEKIQLENLKKTVKRIYGNVSLYRERMDAIGVTPDDIKTLDDIKLLPFTSKQDLRDTYPYGMFAVPLKDVVRLHASSGTTGKQIVVGYTQHDIDVWDTIVARSFVAAGADEDSIVQIAYGYGLFTGGMGVHGGATKIGATVVPVSTGNTQRQLNIMKDFGSSVLACTPSYAMYLGESMKDYGIEPSDLHLKSGIFGAEPWTEEMRSVIESTLHIKAYDIYGLTEIMGPGVAYECEQCHGMHVNEDHFIIEIVDPDTGAPLPAGEEGEIVFSAITKEAFPILRFRTHDIGSVISEPCKCGRTFIRMTKPRGRTDDMLIIRGVNVFPSQIESLLIGLGYAPNFQMIVDRKNNLDILEVQVEIGDDSFTDTLSDLTKKTRAIEEEIKSLLGISAKVTLVNPRTIERTTGKSVRVIDRRKLHD